MKTINIKGKEYVPVNERIKYFRDNYKNYRIVSNFIEINKEFCVIKSEILDDAGNVLATGFAREVNGDTYINKTSYVENCETSAIGRALGIFGIGIDEAVASADEIVNAVEKQNIKASDTRAKVIKLTDIPNKKGVDAGKSWKQLLDNASKLSRLGSYIKWCKENKNIDVILDEEFEKYINAIEVEGGMEGADNDTN